MKVLQFLVTADGTFVWPPSLPNLDNTSASFNNPGLNVITLTFFNDVQISRNQFTGEITDVTPINPVTSGLSGTIIVQARPTPNSPWLNITNGTLDISANEVMVQTNGLITGVSIAPGGVTGCNYIFCELTRGA